MAERSGKLGQAVWIACLAIAVMAELAALPAIVEAGSSEAPSLAEADGYGACGSDGLWSACAP